MPRSVVRDVEGGELRVWRTSDGWLHAKLRVIRDHDGAAYDVDARWEVPPGAGRWVAVAGRARDGGSDAARALADAMFSEAVVGSDA